MMARHLFILILTAALGACTLTAPNPAPTPRAPTGQAPAEVLTPNALRTPNGDAPTPTAADTTCRIVNDIELAVRVSTDILAREVTILPVGVGAVVVGRTGQNTWWQVTTADRRTGWVDASAVQIAGDCQTIPILQAPTLTAAATATPSVPIAEVLVSLNVRRGPSIRFNPPIGQFAAGDTTEIIAVNTTRDWYKVAYEGAQGWISGADQYISVAGNVAALPVDPGPPTPTATNTPIPATPTATLDPTTNYLQDPGFEGQYTGRGSPDYNIPGAWNVQHEETPRSYEWQNIRPFAFPHINPPEVRSGSRALNFSRDYGTFTVSVYQQASVPANISVRASAYAWIHTCDPAPTICGSNSSSNARVRIGIDPTGGTNPNSGSVIWSGFATPHDTWGRVDVSAVAQGGTVTVFLYGTQDTPSGLNRLYWDDAGLFVGG